MRLEAILLAGGAGRRFGGAKLMTPYRDGLLIDGALRCALAAPVFRTVVVTGFHATPVSQAVMRFMEREHADRRLRIVHAEEHAEGMAATLRRGMVALLADTQGAFIFLGDMPDIPPNVPRVLATRLGTAAAAAPVFEGRRGHPVLVARTLFPALARLEGDVGARRLLDELGDGLTQVKVSSPGVLFDVDQAADLVT